MQEKKINFPIALYAKLFMVFSILVGVAMSVNLINSTLSFKAKASAYTVEIYLDPRETSMPPDTAFHLMINPYGQGVSYLSTRIFFDTASLKLVGNPNVSNNPLIPVFPPTSEGEANTTGFIDLVYTQPENGVAPSVPFEIAALTFSNISSSSVLNSQISIVDERTEVVDSLSNDLPFTISYATVRPGNIPAPQRAGLLQSIAGPLLQGACPSDLFIDTAIGCIPYSDTQGMAKFFLGWALGIGGGIAFILVVIASYMIITSQGDPKRLQAGKELFVGAISGLLMLIFSAFILRFAGVNLLGVFSN